MANRSYPDKKSVMKRAQELVDAKLPFGDLDGYDRLSKKNKGDLGQTIEESWFGYSINSDKEPDFKEAGVELKVTPYKITRNGVSAKERLVCNIINYMEEVDKTFDTSSFWHKCKCLCILSYLWREKIPKEDLFVDHATLLNEYPEEDLLIIKQDWETIIKKIRAGEAHNISEADTNYLAACTKGKNATTVKKQPFSHIPAKQRAYSLKTTYMTRLLRKFVFGVEENEHIIKDYKLLESHSFDDIIVQMFKPFFGLTTAQIAKKLQINKPRLDYKSANADVTRAILGITGNPDQAEEFRNANITVKTIVVNRSNQPEQAMSFPSFSFTDIMNQEWQDSDVYNEMAASRFLFVVFQRDNKEEPFLREVFFWNMPNQDIDELHRVWENTRAEIHNGVKLSIKKDRIFNSLPGTADSYVAHVRPHTTLRGYKFADGIIIGPSDENGNPKYGNPLPDGRWMTKQCFWFNKTYIKSIIDSQKIIHIVYQLDRPELKAAEDVFSYDTNKKENE